MERWEEPLDVRIAAAETAMMKKMTALLSRPRRQERKED